QPSGGGGWSSGYAGKKWGAVQTTRTGGSNVSAQRTGDEPQQEEEEDTAPSTGAVGSIRDRFAGAAPMGAPSGRPVPQPQEEEEEEEAAAAPPPPMDSKPNASRSIPMPGLPSRPAQPQEEEEEEEAPADETQHLPPPPRVPRQTEEEPEEEEDIRPSSPIRIAQPVARSAQPEEMSPTREPEQAMPTSSLNKAIAAAQQHDDADEEEDSGRGAGEQAAATTFGASAVAAADPGADVGGKRALVQYDYEKAEDNEIELVEGQYVTDIEMVDEDWWMGRNEKGETGLFPSNYVEIVEDGGGDGAGAAAQPTPPPPAPAQAQQQQQAPVAPSAAPGAGAGAGAAAKGHTATAQFDYEAAEDNELSFPDGATITGVEFPDDDWWYGHYNGKEGLFPANYVQLDE
ncbi:hypothetical protein LTS18_009064, partial [Coniosporium uncinatum]